MISINATLIIQVINFLILVFILNRLLFRPILKLTRDRTQFFQSTKDEISQLEQETQELKDKYQSIQNDARREAARERDQMKSTSATEIEGFLNESRNEASKMKSEAEKKSEMELKQAKPSLSDEAGRLSDVIVQMVIGRTAALIPGKSRRLC